MLNICRRPPSAQSAEGPAVPKTPEPRKKGNRWEINYLDATGNRRWRTFRTRKEASSAIHHLNSEAEAIRAGVRVLPPEPHSFDELANYWLEKKAPQKRSGKDDRSIINKHLRPYFGAIELPALGVEVVDQFVVDMEDEVSPKTLHNVLTLLGTMLRQAVRLKWIVAIPPIDKPRLQDGDYKWLRTTEEIRKLLLAAQAEDAPGVLMLYTAAFYTGMRAGELLGLRWEDVDLEQRLITVKRSYGNPFTKNSRIRHVPILTPLLKPLREWRLQAGGPWVFPNRQGNVRQPSDRWLQELFKRCLERAGLTPVRFHDLRHTFASHWVMSRGDIFRLKKVLGHSDIKMTLRYAHLAPDVYREDYERLPDLVPGGGGEVLAIATGRG
jgi:integrase